MVYERQRALGRRERVALPFSFRRERSGRVPTYDYQCEACGRTYEIRQRISAPPLTVCQYCQGPVRRLIAAAPFILKGRGWYVTDYPSESRKKSMESEKKAAETAGTSSATSSSTSSSSSSPSSPSSTPSTSSSPGGSSSTSTTD